MKIVRSVTFEVCKQEIKAREGKYFLIEKYNKILK